MNFIIHQTLRHSTTPVYYHPVWHLYTEFKVSLRERGGILMLVNHESVEASMQVHDLLESCHVHNVSERTLGLPALLGVTTDLSALS